MPRKDPFARVDEAPDEAFYAPTRLVVHIGDGAIASLVTHHGRVIPAGSRVLDLMSSWRSHLPEGLGPVLGLGMNAAELAANPQLEGRCVHNLNTDPHLPFEDGSFDAVTCTVSVQYLTRPLAVFAEVRRVLVPGGVCVVSFSNRCFPTKAVLIWRTGTDADHVQLVGTYLLENGFTEVEGGQVPTSDDPLFIVQGVVPMHEGGGSKAQVHR